VYSIDFPARYNDWERTDPESLFDAETEKNEANPKVCAHMKEDFVWC
jgi:DNA topoisomerase-3